MSELIRDDMTLQEDDTVLVQLDNYLGVDREGTIKTWVVGKVTMNESIPIQAYKIVYPLESLWYGYLISRDSDRVIQVKKTDDAYKEFALITLNDSY